MDHPNLVLICTKSGKVVFSQGDQKVLNKRHFDLLHSDIFELPFTLLSKLSMQKYFGRNNGIFMPNSYIQIELEIINHEASKTYTVRKWEKTKNSLITTIQMNISMLGVKFKKEKIKVRKVLVAPLLNNRNSDADDLFLIELSQIPTIDAKCSQKDYEYCLEKESKEEITKVKIEVE